MDNIIGLAMWYPASFYYFPYPKHSDDGKDFDTLEYLFSHTEGARAGAPTATRASRAPEDAQVMSSGAIERDNVAIREDYPFDNIPGLPEGFTNFLEQTYSQMAENESLVDPMETAMFQFYSHQHRLLLCRNGQ